MKFIDLFAGLGGFHFALTKMGHECVFASEKKENLAKLYKENYNIEVNRDIRLISPDKIPSHEILCAGFPCQPFSKAGKQKGLKDENNGSFFDILAEILNYHKPKYFILENVRNLESHDDFKTWDYISLRLEDLGYSIDKKIFSPHQFNIPQHRERLFIVGCLDGLNHFKWPETSTLTKSTKDFLRQAHKTRLLEEEKKHVLNVWQEFLDIFPKKTKIPGFPIWAMEFGADYPYETSTPYSSSNWALGKSKGSFGVPLKNMTREDKFKNLPSYARTKQEVFPTWKQNYIRKNREFYQLHKTNIDSVIKKIKKFNNSSWQKLEWNCGDSRRNIKDYIIQFRASGVRIKKPDIFPSLVTVSTQVPIIGWENRYISPEEGAALQSMEGIKLPENLSTSFSALGNAVNAKIVKLIAEKLIINQPCDHRNNLTSNIILSEHQHIDN